MYDVVNWFNLAGLLELYGDKIYISRLPSYIVLHACDLFLCVNVNVNMYFEAVLVHLAIDVVT